MTSTSGRAATIAAAVSRMRAISLGSRRAPAERPSRRCRRAGTGCAALRPPSPRRRRPKNAIVARRRLAQRPHQLEAELIARMLAGDQDDAQRLASAALTSANPTTNRPAASAARAKRSLSAISTRPAASATPSSSARRRALDRLRPDRRHVEPHVLTALGRLDQHARRGRADASAARRAIRRRGPASRRCPRPPRSPARARWRRPRPARRRTATARRSARAPRAAVGFEPDRRAGARAERPDRRQQLRRDLMRARRRARPRSRKSGRRRSSR